MDQHDSTTDETGTPSPTRDRTIRHTSGLDDLMRRRGDLEGVLPMADLIRESLRWTA